MGRPRKGRTYKDKTLGLIKNHIIELNSKIDDAILEEKGTHIVALCAMGFFARTLLKELEDL